MRAFLNVNSEMLPRQHEESAYGQERPFASAESGKRSRIPEKWMALIYVFLPITANSLASESNGEPATSE